MKKNNPTAKLINPDSLSFPEFTMSCLEGHTKYIPNPNYFMTAIILCLGWLVAQASLGDLVFTHSSQAIISFLPNVQKTKLNDTIFASPSANTKTESWSWDSKKKLVPFLKNLAVYLTTILLVLSFWIASFKIIGNKQRWSDMIVVLGICSLSWTMSILLSAILYSMVHWIAWKIGILIIQGVALLFISVGILTSFLLLYILMGQILFCKGKARYFYTITTTIILIVSLGFLKHWLI